MSDLSVPSGASALSSLRKKPVDAALFVFVLQYCYSTAAAVFYGAVLFPFCCCCLGCCVLCIGCVILSFYRKAMHMQPRGQRTRVEVERR